MTAGAPTVVTGPPAVSRPSGHRGVLGGWVADLLLGLRLAVRGGRAGWFRLIMTGLGVGFGVAVLLAAAAAPHALQQRDQRSSDRSFITYQSGGGKTSAGPVDRQVLVRDMGTDYHGRSITGTALQPVGRTPALPPGVAQMPGPGQMLVSPALAKLLSSPEGRTLRDRLSYRIVGTIDDDGLSGPREYAFYLGTDKLSGRTGGAAADPQVQRVGHFGDGPQRHPLDPVLTLLTTVATIVLLLPVAVFVAAAVRTGGEARDRRLAALRLTGADGRMTRRIAAGEGLAGTLAGLVLGGVLFYAGRQLVPLVAIGDISAFPTDLSPAPALIALIAVGMPAFAVLLTLFALRSTVIEPLGVVRRARRTRRRLWWRLLPPAAGLACLLPMVGGITPKGGMFSELQVSAGIVLLLAGAVLILPWLVAAVVRRLPLGGLGWHLAVRRLQSDDGTSVRAVSGIAVAVAGAIALQTLFTGAMSTYTTTTHQDTRRAQVELGFGAGLSPDRVQRIVTSLRDTKGVTAAYTTSETIATPVVHNGNTANTASLVLGDCATLRQIAILDHCQDGDVFLAPTPGQPGASSQDGAARAGQRVLIGEVNDDANGKPTTNQPSWTVPATARTVTPRVDPSGQLHSGIFATPGAIGAGMLSQLNTGAYLSIDRNDPDAMERVRATAARLDPFANVQMLQGTQTDARLTAIAHGLSVGAVAILVLIGASLLLGLLEQLRERRRTLAVLAAFGARRGTVTRSVLWQATLPMLLGLVLAVAIGTGLGALLLGMVRKPVSFDWAAAGELAGVGALVVLLVTLLSLPAVRRLMRPANLRAE